MSTLHNETLIHAQPEQVWEVLTNLDLLEEFDPAVTKSEILGPAHQGIGAVRKCEVEPNGWFKEKVTEWAPHKAVTFELTECNFPVHSLRHSYQLTPEGNGTRVTQVMQYKMKYGILGWLMDTLMVRKKYDEGIKGFFAGLKGYVEKTKATV